MDRVVFLDRDGTVIVDHGYLDNAAGVELLPGAGEALSLLMGNGFLLVLVTNQSGIGRGYFPRSVVEQQHARLGELLAPFNVKFAAIEVCPHTPSDGCSCRKPEAGMLRRAAEKLGIRTAGCYMVGDKQSDVAAGRNAGCTTVMLGGTCPEADTTAADLVTAARWIVAHARTHGD
jgi:histidinol-phosphate phosphatase family protein